MWKVHVLPTTPDIHVTPEDDTVAHDLDDDCACVPTLDPVVRRDGSVRFVLVHHSLDGREQQEQTPC